MHFEKKTRCICWLNLDIQKIAYTSKICICNHNCKCGLNAVDWIHDPVSWKCDLVSFHIFRKRSHIFGKPGHLPNICKAYHKFWEIWSHSWERGSWSWETRILEGILTTFQLENLKKKLTLRMFTFQLFLRGNTISNSSFSCTAI